MLNWIWLGLVLSSITLAALSGQLTETTQAAFDACNTAVMKLALPLLGIWALWLGMMRLAEKAGLVEILARFLKPLLRRLFPDVPANHPAMGSMVMNMAANMLGLSNAATPLGLRAMQHLETLNPRPGTATNAMCTFLAINTSSIQLIPTTVIGILIAAGAAQPTSIIGTSLATSICSMIVAIFTVKTLEKLPFFALPPAAPVAATVVADPNAAEEVTVERSPLSTRGKICLFGALAFFTTLLVLIAFTPHQFEVFVNHARAFLDPHLKPFAFPSDWASKYWLLRLVDTVSLLAIPFMFMMFPLYAAARHIPIYEEFVEGAKEGFQVAVRVIPYLVAILSAIGMFRAAGGINLISRLMRPALDLVGFPTELLPLAIMRPLSGSGATAIFAELVNQEVKTNGPDSLIVKMGATIMGGTETTFYVLAVYFGSVAIRRTRHAVAAGLAADITGVIVAVAICRLVFAR